MPVLQSTYYILVKSEIVGASHAEVRQSFGWQQYVNLWNYRSIRSEDGASADKEGENWILYPTGATGSKIVSERKRVLIL